MLFPSSSNQKKEKGKRNNHCSLDFRLAMFRLFCGVFLLLSMSCRYESAAADSDRLALLDFKNLITQDPHQIMNSWNDSVHFCNWVGVSCNPSTRRVTILNLESQRLAGSISPSIGNLSHLTGINLKNNSFRGQIPEQIGQLSRLRHINLTYNSFGGKIPGNITNCKELRVIGFSYNSFVGEIPNQLSSLSKLASLQLGANNFTGTIPTWIGNFSALISLSLALNSFHGNIPSELGRLSNLGLFQVYGNFLSGVIPPQIYNISSIYYFVVAQNQLHGELPPDVGLKFPSLQVFAGGVNNFTGPIPASLTNASGLQVLDFAVNSLSGTVPRNLGNLKNLYRFNFDENELTGDLNFLSSLANCTSLQVLGLAQNHFAGELPSSIANLSTQLQTLTIGRNMLQKTIPKEIGNLVNLALLGLEGNYLSGSVPDVIGKLKNLQGLHLNFNRFSGLIPSSFGNLSRLTRLFLEGNSFQGSIPPSLGNCQNLQNLFLSSNNLSGTVPKELLGLSSLSVSLVMSNNYLTGPLPLEIKNLRNLVELDISENKISGGIPTTLGSCVSLERLYMQSNGFEGRIPESLKELRGIAELDLSSNNLSGNIPEFLTKLRSLEYLNLSHNDFKGEVPKEGIFANISAISLNGNDKLCGGIPYLLLPPCFKRRNAETHTLRIVIPVATAISLLLIFSCVVFYVARSSRHSTAPPQEEWQGSISYSELRISTDGFAAENLIGSGSFGSVYKGVIPSNGRIVAVKVLNLQQPGASKSFFDECNALRSIRHRNLLKIINTCSTVDHRGNDFKSLVYEFVSNGNLDQWLHPTTDEQYRCRRLSLIQRLNIAIDVASALDYLHHYSETPIVHCDLKPSNVLLDNEMTARVGDFGLARFLFDASKDPSKQKAMSISLKGSIGYIPPEYGFGNQVSILGDVYSYGILLLEMFTGKRPTDNLFKEDLSIYKYVEMAWPEHLMAIIDQSMLAEEEIDGNECYREERAIIRDHDKQACKIKKIEECLVSLMKIALTSSARTPGQRMGMDRVVNILCSIRDSFLK